MLLPGVVQANVHNNFSAHRVMPQGDRKVLQNVQHTCTSVTVGATCPDPYAPNNGAPQDNGGQGMEGGKEQGRGWGRCRRGHGAAIWSGRSR